MVCRNPKWTKWTRPFDSGSLQSLGGGRGVCDPWDSRFVWWREHLFSLHSHPSFPHFQGGLVVPAKFVAFRVCEAKVIK